MALLVLSSSVAARAQTAAPAHSHGNFECLPDGLTRNKSFGCRLLAQPIIDKLPDEPVFWHLTTFPTRRAADAAKRSGDAVVTADGRVWLSSIGSRSDTILRGKLSGLHFIEILIAEIGVVVVDTHEPQEFAQHVFRKCGSLIEH